LPGRVTPNTESSVFYGALYMAMGVLFPDEVGVSFLIVYRKTCIRILQLKKHDFLSLISSCIYGRCFLPFRHSLIQGRQVCKILKTFYSYGFYMQVPFCYLQGNFIYTRR
jgi:hypothetical protein